MDLNHDKQIQSLLCYRYTIGQDEASVKLKNFMGESSCQIEVPQGQKTIARSFNCGSAVAFGSSPAGVKENARAKFLSPLRGLVAFGRQFPQLKLRVIFSRASGAAN
jgi:hypothetical protein